MTLNMRKKPTPKSPIFKRRRDAVPKLLPARTVSAANRIVNEIREALLAGKFHSGDFLGTETTLAGHFNVGRSPIRDALRSLEAMGIIDIRVGLGGGVYVADGNPDLFAEMLAIQLKLVGVTLEELLYAIWAVEGMAVDLAIDKLTRSDLETLFAILNDLRGLLDRPQKFVLRSMDFHSALVGSSHSRALIAQATMLRYILFKHYAEVITPRVAQDVFGSLEKLLGYIDARSHEAARAQVSEHYRMARDFLLSTQQPVATGSGRTESKRLRRPSRLQIDR